MTQTLPNTGLFADPSKWVVRRAVPVFVEHDEVEIDADGQEHTERFGRKELEAIARDSARRERETGDPAPIMLGHIPRNKAGAWHYERDLGKIVGFARNFRVGYMKTRGKDGKSQKRLAVLVDKWFRKDRYQEAMEYPRRSVELWDKRIIDPICLLKRTPQLDLGLVTADGQPETEELPRRYGRDGAELLCYQRGPRCRIYQMEDSPVDDSIKTQLADLLQQAITLLQGGGEESSEAEGQPEQFGAAGASGTNTGMPAAAGSPMPYARDAQALKRAKDAEKAAAKAKADAEHYRKLYQRTQRQQQLAEIAVDHELDVDDELAETEDLDDARFERHLERCRKYQRRDSGQKLIPTGPAPTVRSKNDNTREKSDRAVAYATEHGCSFNEALTKV